MTVQSRATISFSSQQAAGEHKIIYSKPVWGPQMINSQNVTSCETFKIDLEEY